MKDVNIYICTEYTGSLRTGTGKYHVILEYMAKTRRGEEPATLKEIAICEDITRNRLELLALVRGMEHLTVPCRICIHTASEYVTMAFHNSWIEKWSQNNFCSKNKPIKHADLWQDVAAKMKIHDISVTREERTSYTGAQRTELKNYKKKRRGL